MRVRELISELQKLKGNSEVILSSDNEGNNFAGLGEVCDLDEKVVLYPKEEYLMPGDLE